MASKKRDYKAEYKRRIARAKVLGISKSVARGHPKKGEKPLASSKYRVVDKLILESRKERLNEKRRKRYREKKIEDAVAADAKRVFGKKPKRTKEEQFPIDYEIKLADLKRREGQFEWTDEAAFVGTLQALGMTAHDAYTLWFSP